MVLTRRRKIIIGIIIAMIIILLLLMLFVFFRGPEPVVNENINEVPTAPIPFQPEITPNASVLADIVESNGSEVQDMTVEQVEGIILLAVSFTERFGSYSNQSGFTNFDDLEVFMTDSLQQWVVTHKQDLQNQHSNLNNFYGMETKAISNEVMVLDEDAGVAEVMIKTQRQEYDRDITNPNVFYQDILIKLIKIEDEWKVNGAYWR